MGKAAHLTSNLVLLTGFGYSWCFARAAAVGSCILVDVYVRGLACGLSWWYHAAVSALPCPFFQVGFLLQQYSHGCTHIPAGSLLPVVTTCFAAIVNWLRVAFLSG